MISKKLTTSSTTVISYARDYNHEALVAETSIMKTRLSSRHHWQVFGVALSTAKGAKGN